MAASKNNDRDNAPPLKPDREVYHVVVQCESEDRQREIYQRMTAEGLRCRVLTM